VHEWKNVHIIIGTYACLEPPLQTDNKASLRNSTTIDEHKTFLNSSLCYTINTCQIQLTVYRTPLQFPLVLSLTYVIFLLPLLDLSSHFSLSTTIRRTIVIALKSRYRNRPTSSSHQTHQTPLRPPPSSQATQI
jgi:hypothetical protein